MNTKGTIFEKAGQIVELAEKLKNDYNLRTTAQAFKIIEISQRQALLETLESMDTHLEGIEAELFK